MVQQFGAGRGPAVSCGRLDLGTELGDMGGASGGGGPPQLVRDELQSVVVTVLGCFTLGHQQVRTVASERRQDRRQNG